MASHLLKVQRDFSLPLRSLPRPSKWIICHSALFNKPRWQEGAQISCPHFFFSRIRGAGASEMEPRGDRSVPRERDLSHSPSHWRSQGTQLIQAERPGGRLLSGSRSGTSTKQEQDFRPKKGQEHGRRKCKRPFVSFKIIIFFWRAPFFFKSLLNLLQYCFCFMFWFFWPRGM